MHLKTALTLTAVFAVATFAFTLLPSDAEAYRQHPEKLWLFKKGCYMENSELSQQDFTTVCGVCRNTGYQVCCNAFSQSNSYSCGVTAVAEGSGTATTISEAAARACGCY